MVSLGLLLCQFWALSQSSCQGFGSSTCHSRMIIKTQNSCVCVLWKWCVLWFGKSIQARLAQIWQLSASVFLLFASQKMGFQSVRSRRSTGSFWHGTWQCFGLPWPPPAIGQTSPNIPNSFSFSRLPHTGWTGHGLISSDEPGSINARYYHAAFMTWVLNHAALVLLVDFGSDGLQEL